MLIRIFEFILAIILALTLLALYVGAVALGNNKSTTIIWIKKRQLITFPTKSIVGEIKPTRLKYFLLGPRKWGKTKFFSGAPGVLLLAFEDGHFFARCPKVVITSWANKEGAEEDDDGIKYCSALEIIEALETVKSLGPLPFKLIVMDTADMARLKVVA
jgi:hypothetical protein